MEKHTVNGITFRYIHLGQHRIRVLLGHLDKSLRENLHKATCQTSHTTGKTILEKNGDLICRMVPTKKMKFQQLIKKVFNLMAAKITRHNKKTGNVQAAASTSTRRKSRNRRGRRYHGGALAT